MKCLWLVLVVAACGGGVSSNPPGSWDPTLANPCTSMLTFDQAQMTMEACGSSCIENHDLPGTSPQQQ